MIFCNVVMNVMKNGSTAIIWAALKGHIDCLKLLVDSGGDINVRDNVSDLRVMILLCVHALVVCNYFII